MLKKKSIFNTFDPTINIQKNYSLIWHREYKILPYLRAESFAKLKIYVLTFVNDLPKFVYNLYKNILS